MTTLYRTRDGAVWESKKRAEEHERLLDNKDRRQLELNLEIYLANKSRLKHHHLRDSEKRLKTKWEEFLKLIPKRPEAIADARLQKKLDTASADLYNAAVDHMRNVHALDECRVKIPRIQAELKEDKDVFPVDLLPEPKLIRYFWQHGKLIKKINRPWGT